MHYINLFPFQVDEYFVQSVLHNLHTRHFTYTPELNLILIFRWTEKEQAQCEAAEAEAATKVEAAAKAEVTGKDKAAAKAEAAQKAKAGKVARQWKQ